MAILPIVLCALLGTVFVASAAPKLRHPKGFILTVLEYRMFPPRAGRIVAQVLPPLELFVGLLLLTGSALRLATMLAALLLCGFVLGIAVNLRRGRLIDCGCFGAKRRQISSTLLVQDGALLGVTLVLFVAASRWIAPSPWSPLHFMVHGPGSFFACLVICLVVSVGAGVLLDAQKTWRRTFADSRRSSAWSER
jgi:uncharacterized membrane protein YphA (DoxX/SURF4 family)